MAGKRFRLNKLALNGVELPFELTGEFEELDGEPGPVPTPVPKTVPQFPATAETIFQLPVSNDYLIPKNVGNNPGGTIEVANFEDGTPVYVFKIQHNGAVNPNGTGARFFVPWDLLRPHVGKRIRVDYAKYLPHETLPQPGGDKFFGFGAQSKTADAVIWAYDAETANGKLQAWLFWKMAGKNLHPSQPTPIPFQKWVTDTFEVLLKPDASGEIKIAQDGAQLMADTGQTAIPAGAGLGLALYSNAFPPDRVVTAYFTGMRVNLIG